MPQRPIVATPDLLSLDLLSQCLDDFRKILTDFIKSVLATIHQGDNIIEERMTDSKGDTYLVFMLVASGEYRQVACIS